MSIASGASASIRKDRLSKSWRLRGLVKSFTHWKPSAFALAMRYETIILATASPLCPSDTATHFMTPPFSPPPATISSVDSSTTKA